MSSQWSTHGGDGYRPRTTHHTDELGGLWTACGVSAEWHPLQAVILAEVGEVTIPNAAEALMMRVPDVAKLNHQRQQLKAAYEQAGVTVFDAPPIPGRPNHIFMRDRFWMTPAGAVISRMATEQRAGEEPPTARLLAQLGIPIVATIHGNATFEGADALWITPHTVAVGVDQRTNRAGLNQITAICTQLGARVIPISLGNTVQHLLGAFNLVDRHLAVHRPEAADLTPLKGQLELLPFDDTDEVTMGRGLNFVTLGPGSVLMPAGCPRIQSALEAHGVQVITTEVGEYLAAAGGPACATGIVQRLV